MLELTVASQQLSCTMLCATACLCRLTCQAYDSYAAPWMANDWTAAYDRDVGGSGWGDYSQASYDYGSYASDGGGASYGGAECGGDGGM